MTADYEFEAIFRIHSNNGYHYEVRQDPDGLGIIEIAYIDSSDRTNEKVISMEQSAARLVIKALDEILRTV